MLRYSATSKHEEVSAVPNTDQTRPNDLTHDEANGLALVHADLDMLSDLVEMRHASGLTQEQVAERIGRNKSAVSRFERLDSDPRLSTIRRYARAVGAVIEHRVSDFATSPHSLLLGAITISTDDEPQADLMALVFGDALENDEPFGSTTAAPEFARQ
jgi:transcriptional regulator with XRE-family HTH domain